MNKKLFGITLLRFTLAFAFLLVFIFLLTKPADAANKATNLTITEQRCTDDGKVAVSFSWTRADCYNYDCTNYPLVTQYLDYTVIPNMAPDDSRWIEENSGGYSKNTNVGRSATSRTLYGFAQNLNYWWRINTDYGGYLGGWSPSATASFKTISCAPPPPPPPPSDCPEGCTYVGGVCGPREKLYGTCATVCGSDSRCNGLSPTLTYPYEVPGTGGECLANCTFRETGTCPAGCTFVNGVCGPREKLYGTCATVCGSDSRCNGLPPTGIEYPADAPAGGGQCSPDCQFIPAGGVDISGGIRLTNPLDADSLEELIDNIINFIFWVATALVPLMIVIGAFYFLTSAGNPRQIDTAKRIILYSLIGYAIILISKGLIIIIKGILGAT